jgi:hypothetical protein
MKELMCTHLTKRGSIYYYRRRIPLDLIGIFGTEIMKSLGTKDRKEAEVLVRKMGARHDEEFAQIRSEAAGSNISLPPPQIPQHSQTKPLAFDADLGVEDAHIYAARELAP